jgi:glutamate decarboxylase
MTRKPTRPGKTRESELTPEFVRPSLCADAPKTRLPEREMLPESAYQLIHDELILDGNSRLNLATFVTTIMDQQAGRLMAETFDKNMIDKDEYPQTAAIETRCWQMLANLWNSPDHSKSIGVSTIGSSEACMLGGLAAKWRWRAKRRKAGKPADKPNIIMGAGVQVVWKKFARYFDVEPKYVPMERGRYSLNGELVEQAADENTIAVVAVLGTSLTGEYEPVQEIHAALDKVQKQRGFDIDIHVDGASGAMVAPFLDQDFAWDFRLPRVKSISTSGHKYGLVYPGLGWVVWRLCQDLPEDLVFRVNYLGGEMPTFALNFSRPGSQVIAQYYNFIRYGKEGYTRIQQTCRDVATYLSTKIEAMGPFELVSRGDAYNLPVFTWTMKEKRNWTLYDLAERLRDRGWLVPAYSMPENCTDLVVQRIVVKNGFSHDMADLLLDDMKRHIAYFDEQPGLKPKMTGSHFHH